MIRINLLPIKKSRRQEALRNELILAGLGAAVLIGILGVLVLLISAEVNEARAENKRIQAKIEEMKATVAQVEEVEKLKTDLQQKLTVIKQLKANKSGPVRMLDEIAMALPDKLQLTNLDEDAGLIKLKGQSVSNEVISQFLSNLEQSVYFREIYLNSIDQTTTKDGVKLKNFAITLRLVVPGVTTETEASATETKDAKADTKAGKAGKAG